MFAPRYLVALFGPGLAPLGKAHYWLVGLEIIFLLLWVVGTLIGPAPRATGAPRSLRSP
jgi:hypothetical protein